MKDDAIAQLSDQLLAISTRLQDLERKPLDIEENEYDTYQNQAFGFKIRYPHTWRADEKHCYPENDVFTKVVGLFLQKKTN
jgi:hypothetical protein